MKVHFAGGREKCGESLLEAGVRYRLESFYEINVRGRSDGIDVWNRFQHVIIDSGLFTLMFGAKRGTVLDEGFFQQWLDQYVDFINRTPFLNASFVELDVQKKLGVDAAWELRQMLKARIKRGRVINVYHLEDGNPDRLIDHSDYIAISIPELRFHVSESERERITTYIAARAKRKGKRVHLLGCTELKYLRKFAFCDTCDSTAWQSGFRYGSLKSPEFGEIKVRQIRAQVGGKPCARNDVYWSALFSLPTYQKYAGDQH